MTAHDQQTDVPERRPDGGGDGPAGGSGRLSIGPLAMPHRRGPRAVFCGNAPGSQVIETTLETMAAARIEPEDARAAWPWADDEDDRLDPIPHRFDPPGAPGLIDDISGRSRIQSRPENADAFSDPSSGARAPRVERVLRQHFRGTPHGDRSNGMTGLAA